MPRTRKNQSSSGDPSPAPETPTQERLPAMTSRQITWIACAVIALIATLILSFKVFENVDAGEIVVIQSPVSGEMTWHTTPGVKWQGFGAVTKYQKRNQFWFSDIEGQGKDNEEAFPIMFNDGGKGKISGSIAWEMPLDPINLTELHTRYGSQHAIEQQLVRTVVEKSIFMTGPLMSSTESYAARRNELLSLINDQIVAGVYKTESHDEKVKDSLTGIEKTVKIVKLVVGKDGKFEREVESPLSEFGIKAFNLSINKIPYDEIVEKQIAQQQDAIMQVQTAIAKAKTAEQDAITAEKKGEAEAAKAKWEQMVVKARVVTEAEQKLEVAKLETEAAEQKKLADILLGEGESKRRQLVMEADGALEKKLVAIVEINKAYAEAIAKYQGAWVPSVVMGGDRNNQGGAAGVGAMDFISLLTAKTARDLGIDLSVEMKNGGQKRPLAIEQK